MSSKATKLAFSLVLLAGLVAASIAADQEPPPQERIQVQVFDKPFDPPIGPPPKVASLPRQVAKCLGSVEYVGRVSFAEANQKVFEKARLAMVKELVNSKLKELKLKPHQDRDEYRKVLRRTIEMRFEFRLSGLFYGHVSTREALRPVASGRAVVSFATGRFLVFGATPEAVEELARGFIASYDKQAILARQSAQAELPQKQQHLSKLQQELDKAEKNYQNVCRALVKYSAAPQRLGEDLVARQMMMKVERQGLEQRITEAKRLLAEGKKSPAAQARIEEILFEDQIKLAGLLGEREGLAKALFEQRMYMEKHMLLLNDKKAIEKAVNKLKDDKARTELQIKKLAIKLEAAFAPLKLTEPIQIGPVAKRPSPRMSPRVPRFLLEPEPGRTGVRPPGKDDPARSR